MSAHDLAAHLIKEYHVGGQDRVRAKSSSLGDLPTGPFFKSPYYGASQGMSTVVPDDPVEGPTGVSDEEEQGLGPPSISLPTVPPDAQLSRGERLGSQRPEQADLYIGVRGRDPSDPSGGDRLPYAQSSTQDEPTSRATPPPSHQSSVESIPTMSESTRVHKSSRPVKSERPGGTASFSEAQPSRTDTGGNAMERNTEHDPQTWVLRRVRRSNTSQVLTNKILQPNVLPETLSAALRKGFSIHDMGLWHGVHDSERDIYNSTASFALHNDGVDRTDKPNSSIESSVRERSVQMSKGASEALARVQKYGGISSVNSWMQAKLSEDMDHRRAADPSQGAIESPQAGDNFSLWDLSTALGTKAQDGKTKTSSVNSSKTAASKPSTQKSRYHELFQTKRFAG